MHHSPLRRSRLRAVLGSAGLLFFLPLLLHAEKPEVRVRLVAPPGLAAGSRATLVVEMTLGAGWHVNSHAPADKFLVPTDVALAATAGALSDVRYPADVEKRLAFSEDPMRVYEGTVRFESDLSLPADAGGDVTLSGTVAFQACNDRQCFPPAKLPFEARVAVVRSGSSAP